MGAVYYVERAAELENEALQALRLVEADPEVPESAADRLREIALYVVNRTH